MTNDFENNESQELDDQIEGLDSGNKSLSDALRVSFVILKLIMVVLVLLYFASGVYTVQQNERALVMWFGKARIQADGEKLIGPGLHWTVPYPIAEIIKVPSINTKKLSLESFWYYQTEKEKLSGKPGRVANTLNPIKDGYCLTRGEKGEGISENDYNIVHCNWEIDYNISRDPYAFFKNVYIETPKPGELYSTAIDKSIKPFLSAVAEDAIVTTMVKFTIDEIVISDKTTVIAQTKKLLQSKLDEMESGIQIENIQIKPTWPRQVDNAFQQSIIASQQKETMITDAEGYKDKTLNEAQGPAQEIIAKAKAYRTTIAESAKANADYLSSILPQYQQRPKLVVQKIYQDAIEQVLNNAQEKIIVQPASQDKDREFRVLINRDPAAKKKDQNK